ncbi:phage antirepressor KilAC domain-containing protein [Comamonas thiooxydans]|uniref:phage antirepressor KilAC domain-containing protein n=1 Tax=Comamonas thiooxydans TaxID=363952 RepID=UPI002113E82D|nr:phage antirepressor KilAC domain-containing protein [Comamonas thiooxydans]MDH1477815.1 phage antirepressor KilAC domain-containing protein [Comamonas thiooxydans]UUE95383.1 phage antirepressor KilAC domain-containing protein [Comamonas thiooxydans]
MSLNSTLSPAAVPLTMSSRDIADLTGKEHFHVMRDLRALQGQLGAAFGGSIQKWIHPQNDQTYDEFLLDKNTVLTLLLGYDPVARMKVVKRWQELEAQQAPKLPQTMAQALRLAAEQAEQIEAQQEQLALAAPKVAFVDRYVAATSGEKGFREVCKLLGANEHEFSEFLARAKIMYRLAGKMTPHAEHLAAGRFKVKTGTAPRNEHAYAQAKFTPKGVEWVAGLWGTHKARLAQEGGAA